MTASVADSERRRIGPRERIGAITLLQAAFWRTKAAGLPLLALWLVMGVIGALIEQADRWLKPETTNPVLSVNGVATGLTAVVLSSFGSAIGIRLLLDGPARWRTVDRPLLECAGVFALMSLVVALTGWAYGAASQSPEAANLPMLSMAFGGVMLAIAYVMMKLILWPIARLTGRPEITAGRSWKLMRKATRGYALAHAVLLGPLIAAFAGVFMNLGAAGLAASRIADIGVTFVIQAFSILSLAISATVYALRVENPATVADVFD